jgi:glyoxylase-like metal-dependent hydrolase (beta-lactamase superfamily II)
VKVFCLGGNDNNYSCKAYLILGDWNSLNDVNTLVDVGVDDWIVHEIEGISTGVGKTPVEQIILTHSHYDHAGGLAAIKAKYGCKALAFSESNGVDELLREGQRVRMGDRDFEVIQAPEHSSDSICLYCEEEGVIFAGDTPVRIMTAGGSYSRAYVQVLERLVRRRITTIYPGHDEPVTEKAKDLLRRTLQNVQTSEILRLF